MARGSSSKRSFTDNTTTKFPKMGDDGIVSSVVNLSGDRSPYTKAVPKKTAGRGASPTGKYAKKGATEIKEANGPRCNITVPLYSQNSPESSATQRNTRMMKSVMGDQDFGSWREYGQRV